MTETAWALVAVSSDQQEGTLAHQRAWAKETAAAKGWRLTRVFDGVATGKLGPRAVVRKLLAELRTLAPEARPAWILMIRLDRVARGAIVETQLVVHELRKLGVRVWTREDGEVKNDSAMEQMFVAMKATVAAQENAVRSDKRNGVIARKRTAGLPVSPQRPYGLKLDNDKRDVACEPLADAVREAFRLRGDGWGYHAIGNRLREIAPPKITKKGEAKPIRWTTTGVQRLLTQRAYLGPVVDEPTWLRAQAFGTQQQAQYPPRPARHPWPLATAIRCWCGGAMTGTTGGKGTRRVRYYACRAAWNHDGVFRRVNAEILERRFVDLLGQLDASPELRATYTQKAAPVERFEQMIRETRALQADLARQKLSVWDLHARGLVRDEDVQSRLDDLAAQHAEWAKRLAQLEAERAAATLLQERRANVSELVARAAQLFENGSVDQQRKIASSLALTLGGLCCEADGSLSVRAVEDAGRVRRRA